MWIADGWQDYELLSCGGGEKLERWGRQILVRPDPQAIWETPHTNRGWRSAQGRYYRSSSGGGHWDKDKLPESWQEMLRRNWRSSPMWNRKTSKRWEPS